MDSKIWNSSITKLGLSLAFVFGVHSCSGNFITTQERGADFLITQGFINISGGENVDYLLNHCGLDSYARDYQVTNAQGEVKNLRVCMGPGQNSYFDMDKMNAQHSKQNAPTNTATPHQR